MNKILSALLLLILTLSVFVIGYYVDTNNVPTALVENDHFKIKKEKLPIFSIKTMDGETISMQDNHFKNKLIILNFWASWCLPCKEEFPQIIKFVNTNKNVIMLGISVDSKAYAAEKFISNFKLNKKQFIFAIDDKKTISFKIFGVINVPESYFIYNNELLHKSVGIKDWYTDLPAKILQLTTTF